jgi:hypothetical protein
MSCTTRGEPRNTYKILIGEVEGNGGLNVHWRIILNLILKMYCVNRLHGRHHVGGDVFPETLLTIYKTAGRHNPADHNQLFHLVFS